MLLGILFRSWIFRQVVTYHSLGLRANYSANSEVLTKYIDSCIDKQSKPNIKQIIKLGLSLTSSQLHFTAAKNDTDPNKLITSKSAHCVGYASFFASTCNYLLEKYKLSGTWTAKPRIGQLCFLGHNIHHYFNSPFFKDHDFVTIENKTTGEMIAVDPTLNDYLYIDFITYKK